MFSRVELVVGLGNPGSRYDATRHNAGFWWVEALARRRGAAFRNNSRFSGEVAEVRADVGVVRLLKPTTFMNHSGRAVNAICDFYRIETEAVLVVHDEIDLAPGAVRLKIGGGDGGHRGLRDIIPGLGKTFLRLRLGVGRPTQSSEVVDFVLKRPSAADRELIDEALTRSLEQAERILAGETQRAMNELHRPSRDEE